MTESNLYTLLESVVQDNQNFKFPVQAISKELINMLITQEEFDYFMMQAYKVLKRDYGFIYGHIFLTTLETKLNLSNLDVQSLSEVEYQEKISDLLMTLENLIVTRIEKNSPDGEMMSAMGE